ncbi:peroxisome assembly protein (Peroxin-2) [Mycoemilia scoparia]|uniref:RING-type E3 ubiquitin transferase (cysteine targeting) n=1 Tax=Mycoemilia scoparia TaxID=417184 RepID=A0A9W8A868_9FUNG|nr:peroxisome assembly protein (Peroxin-2) [Mycoemilia scoparia]
MDRSAPQSRATPFWLGDWNAAKSGINTFARNLSLQTRSPTTNSRVNKLDADLLDDEIFGMLNEHLKSAFALIKPQFFDKYKPELTALLQSIIFGLSVASSKRATYGQQLQNLKYKSPGLVTRRLYLFGLITIGGQYGWTRLNQYLLERGWADLPPNTWRHRIHSLIDKSEKLFKILSLANFLAFLANGRYKTFIERLLSLKLVYARPQLVHSVSLEFLNRQMVWHAFTTKLLIEKEECSCLRCGTRIKSIKPHRSVQEGLDANKEENTTSQDQAKSPQEKE